jgi:hypothetical protein
LNIGENIPILNTNIKKGLQKKIKKITSQVFKTRSRISKTRLFFFVQIFYLFLLLFLKLIFSIFLILLNRRKERNSELFLILNNIKKPFVNINKFNFLIIITGRIKRFWEKLSGWKWSENVMNGKWHCCIED